LRDGVSAMTDAAATTDVAGPILEVDNLRTTFHSRDGVVRAVDGLSYKLGRGEVLGVVGESGCGKSVAAMSILQLLPTPPGRIEADGIRFGGVNLLELSKREMQDIRGNQIAMIFQEPMTSLNPVLTIGKQISQVIETHQNLSRRAARDKAVEMLRLVRIPSPEQRMREYPHQLSGGMLQRVMIAIALSCNPKVLIADEPTTALDVTIQAQILNLMNDLRERLGTAVILITHDLGVVAEMADRVVVMYAGKKVEEASVEALFQTPRHPYTRGLLASVPRLGDNIDDGKRKRLAEIRGMVPDLRREHRGCLFADRCGYVTPHCRAEAPPMIEAAPSHWTACWEHERVAGVGHA
jgi:oligopeptide/dipeptide ABC transporter ATP-binding protein